MEKWRAERKVQVCSLSASSHGGLILPLPFLAATAAIGPLDLPAGLRDRKTTPCCTTKPTRRRLDRARCTALAVWAAGDWGQRGIAWRANSAAAMHHPLAVRANHSPQPGRRCRRPAANQELPRRACCGLFERRPYLPQAVGASDLATRRGEWAFSAPRRLRAACT